jgi:hypothetical protein
LLFNVHTSGFKHLVVTSTDELLFHELLGDSFCAVIFPCAPGAREAIVGHVRIVHACVGLPIAGVETELTNVTLAGKSSTIVTLVARPLPIFL